MTRTQTKQNKTDNSKLDTGNKGLRSQKNDQTFPWFFPWGTIPAPASNPCVFLGSLASRHQLEWNMNPKLFVTRWLLILSISYYNLFTNCKIQTDLYVIISMVMVNRIRNLTQTSCINEKLSNWEVIHKKLDAFWKGTTNCGNNTSLIYSSLALQYNYKITECPNVFGNGAVFIFLLP